MKVTTNEFVAALLTSMHNQKAPVYSKQELFANGVLEDFDRVQAEEFITKKSAARILHQTLLLVKQEEDVQDWSAALCLRDLYDCHTCVRHIAQVYAKGIMEKSREDRFGNEETISASELDVILDRLWNSEKRVVRETGDKKVTYVSYDELAAMKKTEKYLHCVDVRDADMFLGLSMSERLGFENITLHDIQLNPYRITSNLSEPIILRCQRGYMSTLSANLLLKYGYQRVYVMRD